MEPMSRDRAIELRLTRYFTGKPCKRNHICERYTKSLACIECLHPKFEASDARKCGRPPLDPSVLAARERLKVAKKSLIKLYVILYADQLEGFQASLLAVSMMREPGIQLQNLLSREKPLVSGEQIRYRFNCFPEDESMLLDLGRLMLQSHPSYAQDRASMMRAVNRPE